MAEKREMQRKSNQRHAMKRQVIRLNRSWLSEAVISRHSVQKPGVNFFTPFGRDYARNEDY